MTYVSEITNILDAAGVAYTVAHSTAWSDRFGPSESSYIKFDGRTVRVSCHRYADDAWADTARDGIGEAVKRVAEHVGQPVPAWALAEIAAVQAKRVADAEAKQVAAAQKKSRVKALRRAIQVVGDGPIPANLWQEALALDMGHLCPRRRRAAA